jgi:hypothetical protein
MGSTLTVKAILVRQIWIVIYEELAGNQLKKIALSGIT